jgi:hypothetical protein
MYIHLLVRCHPCPISPFILPLNLTYILISLLHCHERTCPIQISYIPRTKSHIHFAWLRSFIQQVLSPRLFVTFCKKLMFDTEALLIPPQPPKLEDHPLSGFRHCLFSIFSATLHICRPSPPSAI